MFPKQFLMILILPVLLTGCLLMPGQFGSSVDVRKDGTFSFAYKGEIVVQTGDRMFGGGDTFPEPDGDEKCWGPVSTGKPQRAADPTVQSVAPEISSERDCTKEELAERKKSREEARAAAVERRRKEGEQFAQMTGFNPADEEAMAGFAKQLTKQKGWKSAVYKGKGVFDVDYQISGPLDRDFLFPVFPRGNVMFPFVVIRKRADGNVAVNAPALVGGGMAAMAAMYGSGGRPGREMASATRPKGSFTITTDGSILTNNTEDGPAKDAAGTKLSWSIGADTDKVPEALIKLD